MKQHETADQTEPVTTRVVFAERHGASIDVFVQASRPIDGFRPWVLIRDVPHDSSLPDGCLPIAARDEGLRRYALLIGGGDKWHP